PITVTAQPSPESPFTSRAYPQGLVILRAGMLDQIVQEHTGSLRNELSAWQCRIHRKPTRSPWTKHPNQFTTGKVRRHDIQRYRCNAGTIQCGAQQGVGMVCNNDRVDVYLEHMIRVLT